MDMIVSVAARLPQTQFTATRYGMNSIFHWVSVNIIEANRRGELAEARQRKSSS